MKKYLLYLFPLLIFTSCYEENSSSEKEIIRSEPVYTVESTRMIGIVADQTNAILPGYQVSTNNQEILGQQGLLYDDLSNINKFATPIDFSFPDGKNMTYGRTHHENTLNYSEFIIPVEFEEHMYDPQNQDIIEISNTIQIQYVSDAILEEGIAVAGEQAIQFFHLQDIEETNYRYIPSYRLLNKDNEIKFLEISELFYIGAQNDFSRKLYFDSNHTTIENNSHQQLYFWDYKIAHWRILEQEDDILFTHYALGQELDLTMTTISSDGNALPGQSYVKTLLGESPIEIRPLAKNRKVIMHIPTGEEITVQLWNGTQLLEEELFIGGEEQVSLTAANPMQDFILNIDLRNCEDTRLEKGVVLVSSSESTYFFEYNGNPITMSDSGGGDLEIKAYDTSFGTSSTGITLPSDDVINVGRQYVCADVTDTYFLYKAENNYKLFTAFTTSIDNDKMMLSIEDNGKTKFSISFPRESLGDVSDDAANIFLDDEDLGSGYRINCGESLVGCGFYYLDIFYNNEVGGNYLKGTFEGEFWMESLSESNVGYRRLQGEFQIKL